MVTWRWENVEDTIISFERIHERDRQTGTAWRQAASIARQKLELFVGKIVGKQLQAFQKWSALAPESRLVIFGIVGLEIKKTRTQNNAAIHYWVITSGECG